MKSLLILLALAAVAIEGNIIHRPSDDIRRDTILINRPTMPPRFPRFRRSAELDNRERNPVNVQVQKPMSGLQRRPIINIDLPTNLESRCGHIYAVAGISKFPGQKPQTHVRVQDEIRFKREVNPVELTHLSEPSLDVDEKETPITESHISPDEIHIIKREANPQHGSVVITGQKPMSGPDRRPSYGIDYQHNIWKGKNGEIFANGGASKTPGSRPDYHVGVGGRWRFRREANPQHGSVVITGQKPMSGPDRRPSYGIDYQHNIWKGKNGEIFANGGASKTPGSRPDYHVGVGGRWRFRREANPQRGSVVITGQKPLSGPDRRPSYGIDYQHNIWRGKNGEIFANGGMSKTPGSRPNYNVGIGGRWRFR